MGQVPKGLHPLLEGLSPLSLWAKQVLTFGFKSFEKGLTHLPGR